MQLGHLWHGAASAPWGMSKQPPRGCGALPITPWTQEVGEGTEPPAAAAQALYSASLERRGNSTPLPQDSWIHRVSLCLFFLWQVVPTCRGLRFLLFALNGLGSPAHGRHVAPNGASRMVSSPAWLSLAVIRARAMSGIPLAHAEPAVTIQAYHSFSKAEVNCLLTHY